MYMCTYAPYFNFTFLPSKSSFLKKYLSNQKYIDKLHIEYIITFQLL
jgi:hypothetical protein